MAYWKRTMELYDLTPTQVSEVRKRLLVKQGYKCALCQRDMEHRVAFLDHEHHSGALRGVLCFTCNRFRVAKNTRDNALEVVRYLADPPAHALLPDILREVKA